MAIRWIMLPIVSNAGQHQIGRVFSLRLQLEGAARQIKFLAQWLGHSRRERRFSMYTVTPMMAATVATDTATFFTVFARS